MRQFPQEALASRVLARGELRPAHVDALAADVAAFHDRIAVAPAHERFGAPEAILRYALQNFEPLGELADDDGERATLAALEAWTRREHARLAADFAGRREHGFVRECHGDLHLGNMVLIDDRLVVFDCIEFNDELRWIDVASEVAFVVMDLADRGAPALGHRFLNAWLEATGDYGGVALLPFYLAYRAMVRAKIARLRIAQVAANDTRAPLLAEYRGYLALAQRFARPPRAALVVTHGLAGCGKTTATQALVEAFGGVRVRTDVERKRLAGMARAARSGSGLGAQLYARDATRRTYERVASLAESLLRGGELAIVDAACLMRWQRDLFRDLAARLGVPFAIVAFRASEPTLRTRIAQRMEQGSDASEADLAVLEHQLATQEPLRPDEMADVVTRDTEHVAADDVAFWERVLGRIGVDAAAPRP
jgi:predicted kinase